MPLFSILRTFVPPAVLFLLLAGPSEAFFNTCPKGCHCKIYKNKNTVECKRAGFSTVPSTLNSSVHILDLTSNNIKSLPKNIFQKVNLINLHELILKSNRISYVHQNAFSHLALLLDLDLSQNRIHMLHPETFSGLEKMRQLTLSGNFISRLDYHQFPPLTSLHHLSIDNCNLSYINNDAFSLLSNVKSIRLNGNLLQLLEPSLFSNLVHLSEVALRQNPWKCDCRLRDLVSWYQQSRKGDNQVTCASPDRLSSIRWLDLNTQDLACDPSILFPRAEKTFFVGTNLNASFPCGAEGDPLPSVMWLLAGRIIKDGAVLSLGGGGEVELDAFFSLQSGVVGSMTWSNLTVALLGSDFPEESFSEQYDHLLKCVVENAAKRKERNVSLILSSRSSVFSGFFESTYIIVACILVLILVVFLILLFLFCCKRRVRRRSTTRQQKNFLEKNNILIVNPVEKPPRQGGDSYEEVAELELMDLVRPDHSSEEAELLGEGNDMGRLLGRIRSPLTALQEEEFDSDSPEVGDDSSGSVAFSRGLSRHYPDLIVGGTLKFGRSLPPSQYSYRSLADSPYRHPNWRRSLAATHSTELQGHNTLSTHFPQPSFCQRSGYVTLPRRPRTSSVTSSSSLLSRPNYDSLYDTLGPRTTADGTSRLSLTDRSFSPVSQLPSQVNRESNTSLFFTPIMEDPSQLCTLPRSSRGVTASLRKPRVQLSPEDYTEKERYKPTSPSLFKSIVLGGVNERVGPKTSSSSVFLNDDSLDEPRDKLSPPKPLPKPCKSLAKPFPEEAPHSFQDEGPDGSEV